MKKHLLTGLCLAAAASFAASAATTEITFPSQEDFEENWVVVEPNENAEWGWAAPDDFCDVPTLRSYRKVKSKDGPIIRTAKPIDVKPGKAYIYCSTTTRDYNDDTKYWLYFSEDPEFKTITKKIVDGTNRYNPNGQKVAVFATHPTSESSAEVSVEEGKLYYIGIKTQGTGSYSGENCLLIQNITITQHEDTPTAVTSFEVKSHNETPNGYASLSWKWPKTSMLGHELDGKLGAKIYRCPDPKPEKTGIISDEFLIKTLEIEERDVTSTFTYDDNAENSGDKIVTTPGLYHYYVVPFNELGDYTPGTNTITTKDVWIGEDYQLMNPLSLRAMAIEEGVKLTYNFNETRRVGNHGGYVDPSQITLMITRKKGNDETVILTKTWTNFEEYIDTELDGLAKYTYNIYALYKGDEENKNPSNTNISGTYASVLAGGYFDIDVEPFTEDFSTSAAFNDLFTVTGGSGNYCWKHNAAGYANFYAYGAYTMSLITPPLKLSAGKTYKIAFNAWKSGTIQNFSVAKGTSTTDLTSVKNVTINAANQANADEIEVEMSVDADGIYYIAFVGQTSGWSTVNIYLDNIEIGVSVESPAEVTDLAFVAQPTETSDNHATVSFALPTVAKSGSPLTESISKVTVTRFAYGETNTNKEPVSTVVAELTDDLAPGKEITVEDDVEEAGYYGYSVVVELANGKQSNVTKTDVLWVGYDVPKNLYSVSTSVEGNKTNVLLYWTYTPGVQHNGYFDADNLKYVVYRSDKEEPIAILSHDESFNTEKSRFEFVDNTLLDNELVWGQYTYAVAVRNKDKENTRYTTGKVIGGGVSESNEFAPDFTVDSSVSLWDGQYLTIYQKTLNCRNKNQNELGYIYLPPVMLDDPNMLGSTISLELYRENSTDAEYEENGEILEVYLYDLNLAEGQQPVECRMSRSAALFPPVAEEILVGSFTVKAVKDEPMTASLDFVAPKAGKYRLGLKVASKQNVGIYISKFTAGFGVAESVVVPAPVADLTVVPDAEGANEASVEFTLPSETAAGSLLRSLTKVDVLRAAADAETFEVVATLPDEELVPGAAVVVVDKVPEAGFYAYRVVAYVGEEASEAVESEKLWVGTDVLAAPVVVAEASLDGSAAVVTWQMPEVLGAHGGYVNAANLAYKVYRDDTQLAQVTETTYTDQSIAKLPWSSFTYSVVAVSGLNSGETGYAAAVVGGDIAEGGDFDVDFSDEDAVALWAHNGWAHENGSLNAVGANGADHAVYLPPFRSADPKYLGCSLNLEMSCEDPENIEVLHVYACKFEEEAEEENPTPGTPGRGLPAKKTLALTADDKVAEITVSETEKTAHTATFDLPSTGKYRIVLKCASDVNKGLYISTLSFDANKETSGIAGIALNGGMSFVNGCVALPDGCVAAEAFNVAGLKVASAEGVSTLDLSGLAAGVYMVRAVLADGTVVCVKLAK